MVRRLSILLLLLAVASGVAAAQKTLAASKAWIQAPASGASSTTAFVVIENPTMYDVYVVSAASDVAAEITFRKGSEAKAEIVEQVTAPAYDSVELAPEGVHMVLSGLKKPLAPGDKVTIVLTTDSGIALEVSADVRKQ